MAKRKNNVDYYSHRVDSHGHPKFKALRNRYGWEGEGRFWALNNLIGSSENGLLDLNVQRNKLSVAADLNLSMIDLQAYIDFLKSEECSLIQEVETGVFTTETIQEILLNLSERRAVKREKYDSDIRNDDSDGRISEKGHNSDIRTNEKAFRTVECPESKVKYSKAEKKKKEEIQIPVWKNDFDVYLKDETAAFEELIKDQKLIEQQSEFYPGVDITKSFKMAHLNFWGTRAGWNHRRKKKTLEFNWRLTFINALKYNKVYFPKSNTGVSSWSGKH